MSEQFRITIEKVDGESSDGPAVIKIYEQVVSTLDLNALFQAINKPKRTYTRKAKKEATE